VASNDSARRGEVNDGTGAAAVTPAGGDSSTGTLLRMPPLRTEPASVYAGDGEASAGGGCGNTAAANAALSYVDAAAAASASRRRRASSTRAAEAAVGRNMVAGEGPRSGIRESGTGTR